MYPHIPYPHTHAPSHSHYNPFSFTFPPSLAFTYSLFLTHSHSSSPAHSHSSFPTTHSSYPTHPKILDSSSPNSIFSFSLPLPPTSTSSSPSLPHALPTLPPTGTVLECGLPTPLYSTLTLSRHIFFFFPLAFFFSLWPDLTCCLPGPRPPPSLPPYCRLRDTCLLNLLLCLYLPMPASACLPLSLFPVPPFSLHPSLLCLLFTAVAPTFSHLYYSCTQPSLSTALTCTPTSCPLP